MGNETATSETRPKLSVELADVLDISIIDTETNAKQSEILSRPEDSYIDDVIDSFIERNQEQLYYKQEPMTKREDIMMFIAGKLFEDLAKEEIYTIKRLSPYEREVSEQAAFLLQHPDRFGLFERLKNPDLTLVDVRRQVIVGVIDAKLGALNNRAYAQMFEFEDNVRTIMDEVKRKRRAHRPGLDNKTFEEATGISEEVARLNVAPKLRRYFVVPRGVLKPDDPDLFPEINENTGQPMTSEAREERIKWLNEQDINFYGAVFSRQEIGRMSNIIYRKLRGDPRFRGELRRHDKSRR